MPRPDGRAQRPGGVRTVTSSAAAAAAAAKRYLASEEGRLVRHRVASIVIVAAPVASELPFIRRTKVARLLRIAGVGTFLVRGAEWLRDWEPVLQDNPFEPPAGAGESQVYVVYPDQGPNA